MIKIKTPKMKPSRWYNHDSESQRRQITADITLWDEHLTVSDLKTALGKYDPNASVYLYEDIDGSLNMRISKVEFRQLSNKQIKEAAERAAADDALRVIQRSKMDEVRKRSQETAELKLRANEC